MKLLRILRIISRVVVTGMGDPVSAEAFVLSFVEKQIYGNNVVFTHQEPEEPEEEEN